MNTSRYAIVTTTINVPTLLDSYADDAKKHWRDVLFVVVGDKKTPLETAEYCTGLAERSGFTVEYFSPERQEEYLARFPALRDHIQWNCIQRRNAGMLFAYESGADVIATIDDDNFLVSDDYLGTHGIDEESVCKVVRTSTGWINVCRMLAESKGREFYHRGFPLQMRHDHETWEHRNETVRPVVNAGLWLGDPDVDALTRLHHTTDPIEARALAHEDHVAPAKGTWTPFNSQNTALARKVIPAYFLSPKIGRYDDIWAAYVVKYIADHVGDSIRFGRPLVKQERNPHNYWRDLDQERYGHSLTLQFVQMLSSIPLTTTDYKTAYAEIAAALPEKIAQEKWRDDERRFLDGYTEGMQIWSDTFKALQK
jgi:hypothetical protein